MALTAFQQLCSVGSMSCALNAHLTALFFFFLSAPGALLCCDMCCCLSVSGFAVRSLSLDRDTRTVVCATDAPQLLTCVL